MQTIPSVTTNNHPQSFGSAHLKQSALSNAVQAIMQAENPLEGCLTIMRGLEKSSHDTVLAQQIALTVSQADQCEYAVSGHVARARKLGLDEDEILASLEGRGTNKKSQAALHFARNLVRRNGAYSVAELREKGFTDREIVNIVAYIGLSVFANIFNLAANTDFDLKPAARPAHAG